jgi:hypothetical protein
MRQNAIDCVYEFLKTHYVYSEVTSGEFIDFEVIPEIISNNDYEQDVTEAEVLQGVQDFLDWDCDDDGNTTDFKLKHFPEQKIWTINQDKIPYETLTYKGKEYPTRVFNVLIDEHNDDWVHTYCIAPESLIDAIQETGDGYLGDEDSPEDEEGVEVDQMVYHYVQGEYFYLDARVICKKHLDLPMTLQDEVYLSNCR